jgi:hypothetical protein
MGKRQAADKVLLFAIQFFVQRLIFERFKLLGVVKSSGHF